MRTQCFTWNIGFLFSLFDRTGTAGPVNERRTRQSVVRANVFLTARPGMFHVKQKIQVTFSMFHVKHYFLFPSKTTELLCQKYSHQHFLGMPHDIFWGSLQLSISTSFCPYGLANRCLPTVSPKPPPIFFSATFSTKINPLCL